jgi:hypothetical protein
VNTFNSDISGDLLQYEIQVNVTSYTSHVFESILLTAFFYLSSSVILFALSLSKELVEIPTSGVVLRIAF